MCAGIPAAGGRVEVAELLPALRPVMDAITEEKGPSPMPTDRTAAAVVSRLLGDRGPCAQLAKRDGLEADAAHYRQAILALGSGESMAATVQELQAKLDSTAAALAKLSKDAPSADRERTALAEAKAS